MKRLKRICILLLTVLLLAANTVFSVAEGEEEAVDMREVLTLSDETREMEGGVTLRDGNVEVNCAFETQLRILRETMAADVAKALFP